MTNFTSKATKAALLSTFAVALLLSLCGTSHAQLSLAITPTQMSSGQIFETAVNGGDPGSLPLLYYGTALSTFAVTIPLDILPIGFYVLPLLPASGGFAFDCQAPDDIALICGIPWYLQVATLTQNLQGQLVATVSNVVTIEFDCAICSDHASGQHKPTQLTVSYTGEDCSATSHSQGAGHVTCTGDPAFEPTVRIIAADRSDHTNHNASIWFDGVVQLDEIFDVTAANAGRTILKGETFFFVYDLSGNLLQVVSLHTSCSEPLIAGDQYGSIRLLGGRTE